VESTICRPSCLLMSRSLPTCVSLWCNCVSRICCYGLSLLELIHGRLDLCAILMRIFCHRQKVPCVRKFAARSAGQCPPALKWGIVVCRRVCGTIRLGLRSALVRVWRKASWSKTTCPVLESVEGNSQGVSSGKRSSMSAKKLAGFF
jgi:hypothetical protein